MKRVKIITAAGAQVLETDINKWLAEMEDTARKVTNGNIEFMLHDIKYAATTETCEALIILQPHVIVITRLNKPPTRSLIGAEFGGVKNDIL